MSQTSPLLSLPYIQPAQAQKHVTHNEALRRLDALVQLSVESRSVTEPPASPPEGARYIVATGANGDWAGQDHAIALNAGGAWLFLPPSTGWRAWVVDENTGVVWRGGSWQAQAGGVPDRIGLGTSADPVTRLSVASPDTLLTHEGGGHQLKVNKATSADAPGQTACAARVRPCITGS